MSAALQNKVLTISESIPFIITSADGRLETCRTAHPSSVRRRNRF